MGCTASGVLRGGQSVGGGGLTAWAGGGEGFFTGREVHLHSCVPPESPLSSDPYITDTAASEGHPSEGGLGPHSLGATRPLCPQQRFWTGVMRIDGPNRPAGAVRTRQGSV